MLGLIATTRQGADILKNLNWESVRHKGEDCWPVVEVKEEALPYSKWFVSSLAAATGLKIKNCNVTLENIFTIDCLRKSWNGSLEFYVKRARCLCFVKENPILRFETPYFEVEICTTF